jgi:glycerol-3-phosphate acyltransferase PlsY
MTITYLSIAIVAYLLGSIPFGYILVRLFLRQDIRAFGSGNIGATNVARSGAKRLAIVTLFLDAAKGYLAVLAAQHLLRLHPAESTITQDNQIVHIITFPDVSIGLALAAAFAILGHVFPIWLRFRGGKGVATGLGVFLAIAPKAVGVAVVIFLVLFGAFRYVSLASIVAAGLFPIAAMLLYRSSITRTLAAGMWFVSMVIILKHSTNIERLVNRTEHRFGEKTQA